MSVAEGARRRRPGSFHDHEVELLQSLGQHRVLTTPQIRPLHMPDAKPRWAQDVTHELAAAGLAASVPARHTRVGVHFLTEAGHEAIAQAPAPDPRKAKVVTPAGAAGVLQAHTLAVNDVGLAFVMAARERGDECGPFAWRHEVAHSYGTGAGRGAKGGDTVVCDALLRYTLERPQGSRMLTRFIELDRANYPTEDLIAKLRKYAQLYAYAPSDDGEDDPVPGWRALYPAAFPHILVVFAGKPRAELERRMHRVLKACEMDPSVQLATGPSDQRSGFVISCALLNDLIVCQRGADKALRYVIPDGRGPFAPVFRRHDMPGVWVNWLGLPARQ